jgi:hypothetical protein
LGERVMSGVGWLSPAYTWRYTPETKKSIQIRRNHATYNDQRKGPLIRYMRRGVGSNFGLNLNTFQTNNRCSNASLATGSASVISTVDIFTNFLI